MDPLTIAALALLQQAPSPPRTMHPVFYFDSGSTVPLEAGGPMLDFIRQYALSSGVKSVMVAGFTDTLGSIDANIDLARARAQAIADILIADGVDPSISRWKLWEKVDWPSPPRMAPANH